MATVVDNTGRRAQISEGSSADYRLTVYDASDEDAAVGAAYTYLVSNYGSPPTITIGARNCTLRNISADETIKNVWDCVATFGPWQEQEPLQQGESSFSFEIGVQPQRGVLPIGTQSVYKSAADPDPTPIIRLIGDQGLADHEPAGAEIYEPTHSEQETHILASSAITPTYKAAVRAIVGKTNNATFKGNAAGECLLTGVSGQKRGSSDWEVSFRWSVKPNQSGLTVAGITGIDKQGWQYLWPRYFIGADEGGAPILTRQIRYIVVSTVFESANFGGLGIGT